MATLHIDAPPVVVESSSDEPDDSTGMAQQPGSHPGHSGEDLGLESHPGHTISPL